MDERITRHPTADALLARTVDIIDSAGEQSVRVEEISAHCGVSITSLYHHFGNREGLIESAQAERFARTTRRNIHEFVTDVDRALSRSELRVLIRAWVTRLVGSDAAAVRRVRTQVLASALTRPKLMEHVVGLNRTQFDTVAAALERARERGHLGATLDARAAAISFTCLAFGRVLAEIDPVDGPASEQNYIDFATQSIDRLLFAVDD